jgi:hypothetical protein
VVGSHGSPLVRNDTFCRAFSIGGLRFGCEVLNIRSLKLLDNLDGGRVCCASEFGGLKHGS